MSDPGPTPVAASTTPFWLDCNDRPPPLPPLTEDISADLVVIGGGYTGLWTALHAKESRPDADVVLIERDTCGAAASGRNGGMCSPSLTHGLGNGIQHWPRDIDTLLRRGHENFTAFQRDLDRYGIDCGFVHTGKLSIARQPWQSDALAAEARLSARHGERAEFLDHDAVRKYLNTPAALTGLFQPDYALLDPARLADGLREACLRLGVRIAENTTVQRLEVPSTGHVRVHTGQAMVRAGQVALATGAFTSLLRRLRYRVVPVYDYALVTEPLTAAQFASIGWTGEHACTDAANQFHYFRKTPDGRMLWGGYDAIYHYGGKTADHLTNRPATFRTLKRTFRATFPALDDVPFTHSWGGVIDMSSNFTLFAGTAARGRIGYAAGFTGLGVVATRFGALAMLDLLAGRHTARTTLPMIRRKPLPLPTDPLRWIGVTVTRRGLATEDTTGRRSPWLHILDRAGVGFGS
ncbi:FAD-dependent oxidoreductase [Saccharomonospora sp. CUA-673]|uniref:NAD(P)/FAD-dependent oxidoreductase n=1 Tax=Saccharomonospora sp. CUA-673 TaxID=1904969 RepID=UPI000968EE24|nr:FAD-dependent oxidoreductase [Saccharomonospora sp. CUA-673]OLT45220.1 FAD-dependent oxidoreductase [Saccharomonospora sp. CUA-673]